MEKGENTWASILGLDASRPLTRDTLLAAIHPEDRAYAIKAIHATACRSESVQTELRVVRDGHESTRDRQVMDEVIRGYQQAVRRGLRHWGENRQSAPCSSHIQDGGAVRSSH